MYVQAAEVSRMGLLSIRRECNTSCTQLQRLQASSLRAARHRKISQTVFKHCSIITQAGAVRFRLAGSGAKLHEVRIA